MLLLAIGRLISTSIHLCVKAIREMFRLTNLSYLEQEKQFECVVFNYNVMVPIPTRSMRLQADVRSHSIRIVHRLETVCDMCGI